MPGIEAQKAFDLIAERFPGSDANGANARTVFIAQGGEKVTADENQAAIGELASTVAEGAQVDSAVDPYTAHTVSKDASTAYAKVNYKANGQLQDQG